MKRFLFVLCVLGSELTLCANSAPPGTEILWDKFGVPHVYANDLEGLFFAYGYAQMRSHGNLVLKLYGESRGRSAEYWGEKSPEPASRGGTNNLELDRWVQLNEIPYRGEQWFQQQTPEFQRYLTAFAAGMNAFAERHPEQLSLERRRVLPITPVDPLRHVQRIVYFDYLGSMDQVKAAAKAAMASSVPGESNAWAIAPSHSATGHTMLLMNPHLPFADWYTYYEAHLVAPGINLYGSSQVGFPMLRFVFSEYLGFTQTVNNLDGSDLFRLEVTPSGDGYVMDGVVRPFDVSQRTLKVRQRDGTLREEQLVIKKSVHGPVVWNQGGLTLAMKTVALDRPFIVEQYWKMALAHTFEEYQAQVRRLQVPTFNITYADRAGHIMYLYNGTLPKRPQGDLKYWAGIVPGNTSKTLWSEIHTYDELPKVIDPVIGWVQNTNNPPWGTTYPSTLNPADFPAYVADTTLSFRTMRSLRMLGEHPTFDWNELLACKHSTRLELADRILDDVLKATEAQGNALARQAAEVLRKWDRSAESDSCGTLLFEAFAKRFLGPNLMGRDGFAVPGDWREPLTTPRGLKNPAKAVAQLAEAAKETIDRYGALDAPWGKFRRLAIGATDLPGNGADGNLGAFRVMRYGPATQAVQKVGFGDTFVAVVEFGNPVKASVLTTYGNSSQPGSPHSDDQLRLVAEKQMRPALLERSEVEANLESREPL